MTSPIFKGYEMSKNEKMSSSSPARYKAPFPMDKHWEQKLDVTGPSKNMKLVKGSDFNPKCPSDRKTTYVKTNKTDH